MRFSRPALGSASRRTFTARPGNVRPPMAVRISRPDREPVADDPHVRTPKLARLEAALFLADEPLAARRLAEVAQLADTAEAKRLIEQLRAMYDADGTAFQIEELAGGFQLLTRPVYQPWLLRLRRSPSELRLTPTAMETLAIIAYKQPITRAEVESIRGVQSAEVIRLLMERGLVRTAGREQSLGRPQLYATSKKFLQAFGMNSLRDLPEVESLKNPG